MTIMTTLLADAILQGARTARDFLTPSGPPPEDVPVPLTQELQARIEAARDETLEYHRTHRPPNTARNYAPKQREWKAWCATQGFPPGGKYLPRDWVDEGKLLLFIKEEVAARAPRKGARLVDERKRKAIAAAQGQPVKPSKRRKGANGRAVNIESHLIVEGEDDDE